MLRSLLLVGLGGCFGSMARYAVSYAVNKHWTNHFPLGTFLINIIGCFIIGLLFGLSSRNQAFQGDWWLILATGFCGGFTTFSSFALENTELMRMQQSMTALIYTLLSIVLGIILCRTGIWLAVKA